MSLRYSPRARLGRARAAGLAPAIALSVFAGLAVYCALSILAGQAGLFAYRGLEERKQLMVGNLARLGSLNERLREELEALRSDSGRSSREARALGYLGRDEREVVIMGRQEERRGYETGSVVPFDQAPALPDLAAKELAFGAALAVLALGLAPRSRRRGGA
ncbi:MAG TPA: hypothetical protein VFL04_06730 [Rectinemataceae bacterium]|nr:hypothetical protein [Rectinemataceae bacterium]